MAVKSFSKYGVLKRSFTAVSIIFGTAAHIGVYIFEFWVRVSVTHPSPLPIGAPDAVIQLVGLV